MTHKAPEWAPLLGRIFLSLLFILSGVAKITGFAGTAGYIGSVGLPFPEVGVVVAIVVELGAGLALLFGWKTYWAAKILLLWVLILAVIFHRDFSDQNQLTHFLKNISIAGGLIFAKLHGAGKYSLDMRASGGGNPETGTMKSEVGQHSS